MLLQRFNKQDMTVSASQNARNFAPTVFAELPEAAALDSHPKARKKLLREAMDYLTSKERIYQGAGPMAVVKSKRHPCLYAGGVLL
jgi:hypothetical protein